MIPKCTTTNSILDGELRERAAAQEVARIAVVTSPDGNYAVAYLTDFPARPVYLATRRDRATPKLYVDLGRLVSSLADLAAIDIPISIESKHIHPAKSP
jgi:hypothetical protein